MQMLKTDNTVQICRLIGVLCTLVILTVSLFPVLIFFYKTLSAYKQVRLLNLHTIKQFCRFILLLSQKNRFSHEFTWLVVL